MQIHDALCDVGRVLEAQLHIPVLPRHPAHTIQLTGHAQPGTESGRVSPAVFPSGRPLPSTTSAPAWAGLFSSFAGTTSLSDFPRSCIKGLPPQRSPHGPRSTAPPPREPEGRGICRHRGRPRDLPVLAHGDLRACLGSLTGQGPPTTREKRRWRCCLPPMGRTSAPRPSMRFRGSIAPPTRPLSTLRRRPRGRPTHDSGPPWIATPSM